MSYDPNEAPLETVATYYDPISLFRDELAATEAANRETNDRALAALRNGRQLWVETVAACDTTSRTPREIAKDLAEQPVPGVYTRLAAREIVSASVGAEVASPANAASVEQRVA